MLPSKRDISSFVEGNINYYTREYAPQHIREQVLYRMLSCAPCTMNGSCLHCGCATPQLFFSAYKVDKQQKWPTGFYSKEEWESKAPSLPLKELAASHPEVIKKYQSLWDSTPS